MITEVVQVDLKPGVEKEYEAAIAKAVTLKGGPISCELHRSIERPNRYWLLAKWRSVEDHTAFRATEHFGKWRAQVVPFYASTPEVDHTNTVFAISTRRSDEGR